MEALASGTVVLILIIVCTALAVLVAVLLVNARREKSRLDRLLQGAGGVDIEASLMDKFERLEILEEKDAEERKDIDELFRQLEASYQRTGVVKYNAFMENGGKLSFALALLNERDDGIILNVMNSNDGSYCYLKEIEHGTCQIALGKEEAEALRQAMYVK